MQMKNKINPGEVTFCLKPCIFKWVVSYVLKLGNKIWLDL
jgi:hypothetical protein